MDVAPDLIRFADTLADAARAAIQAVGDTPYQDKNPQGALDPVTECDRAAERAMRQLIVGHWPAHGIVGEEYGEQAGSGRFVWSLDPIDGTRAFVCGLPSWTILIALLDGGRPVLGIIDAPRLGERYLGHGTQAALNGRVLGTSSCRGLAEARLATTDPYLFDGSEAEAFARLRLQARLTRYGWDAYAYGRLAAGSLDLVVESGLKPHDYNALVPVVEGAGGIIGNWRGERDYSAGQVVAAATRELFAEAVAALGMG